MSGGGLTLEINGAYNESTVYFLFDCVEDGYTVGVKGKALNLQYHREMDGQVEVMGGRESPRHFEYHNPTRALPRNQLLSHFLQKVSRH